MKKEKIAVALSGGVDSSAALAILKNQNYEVFGITMVMEGSSPSNGESKNETVKNAAEICRFLDVPHLVVNIEKEFKGQIIDNFAAEYYMGRTPNPCVVCNPLIKFGLLLQKAREAGAEKIATGHYVRIVKNNETGFFELWSGVDKNKDQAYFLHRLSQEQLSHSLFPLGKMKKEDVKNYAGQIGLPTARHKESQEICFIPDNDYGKFLMENYPRDVLPGVILDSRGKKIGDHQGLIHYTVGQRKRLHISHPTPLYVIGIDAAANTVVAGEWEELFNDRMKVSSVKWINGSPPSEDRIFCKIRYRHEAALARFRLIQAERDCRVEVIFDEPQRAITPGQWAVFYALPEGEKVLGGGMITEQG